jgi:hypothetical protein
MPRTSTKIISPSQLTRATTLSTVTRSLKHLLPFRFQRRPGDRRDKEEEPVHVNERIKWWNIVPGDKVKILDFKDTRQWRVHSINKLSNKVYVEDPDAPVRVIQWSFFFSNEVLNRIAIQPPNENEQPEELKKVSYSELRLYIQNYRFPGEDGKPDEILP